MSGWSILSEHRGKKKNYANNEKKKKFERVCKPIKLWENEFYTLADVMMLSMLSSSARERMAIRIFVSTVSDTN